MLHALSKYFKPKAHRDNNEEVIEVESSSNTCLISSTTRNSSRTTQTIERATNEQHSARENSTPPPLPPTLRPAPNMGQSIAQPPSKDTSPLQNQLDNEEPYLSETSGCSTIKMTRKSGVVAWLKEKLFRRG